MGPDGWVLEERYLKAGLFAPMEQVGIEGSLEVLLLLAVLYPSLQASGGEDIVGAAHSVAADPTLWALAIGSCLCLATYNPLFWKSRSERDEVGEGGSAGRDYHLRVGVCGPSLR